MRSHWQFVSTAQSVAVVSEEHVTVQAPATVMQPLLDAHASTVMLTQSGAQDPAAGFHEQLGSWRQLLRNEPYDSAQEGLQTPATLRHAEMLLQLVVTCSQL
jgi:hypothetical protein